jgi:hypothetical protein
MLWKGRMGASLVTDGEMNLPSIAQPWHWLARKVASVAGIRAVEHDRKGA